MNIGFVATRFQGNDGVSLETAKWLKVLARSGHKCFLFGGDCDEEEKPYTFLVEEAHFKHPEIKIIHQCSFSSLIRPPEITQRIHVLKDFLKVKLYEFVKQYQIQLLIVQNALAIPLNIPLGIAITEFISETGFPTIAHHHDFFWERQRFLVNCVWDYLNMAFPPHLPTIRHVVINSSASNQLSLRTGISAMLVPNVMDFETPPSPPDGYASSLRSDLGIQLGEYYFLQPTRVVQRKGIEHAIEIIHFLNRSAHLVISHASGDEGYEYEQHLRKYAQALGVSAIFVSDIIRDSRGESKDGRKIYTLWDAYQMSDLVTYPSTMEGFGNAFLEAIYYRRPIIVNNYSIFTMDIKPKGFQVVEFDGLVTSGTIERVCAVLDQPQLESEMVEHNYQLAVKHYSFSVLEHRLKSLLLDCFGEH